MSAAHFLTQVGRLGIYWRQCIHGSERWREPGETAAIEATLEQLSRFLRAHRAGPGSQNDCDQPAAIARSRSDDIVPGCTYESGLHAVGAGIAIDQRIVIPHDAVAITYRRYMPVAVVLRKFTNKRAGKDGQVTRRGHVVFCRQTVWIDKIALRHAQ